ncbi:hypothetical protein EQW73_01095 [Oerskovia turbata]|uniref:Uncharacterized protein n=1 Tax=Oerskovia turbata TaxID=1713 RepID=A0ABY0FAS8_9CELL|nr:hypothetical protein EQW73_01095 [Oerskovia turbata]
MLTVVGSAVRYPVAGEHPGTIAAPGLACPENWRPRSVEGFGDEAGAGFVDGQGWGGGGGRGGAGDGGPGGGAGDLEAPVPGRGQRDGRDRLFLVDVRDGVMGVGPARVRGRHRGRSVVVVPGEGVRGGLDRDRDTQQRGRERLGCGAGVGDRVDVDQRPPVRRLDRDRRRRDRQPLELGLGQGRQVHGRHTVARSGRILQLPPRQAADRAVRVVDPGLLEDRVQRDLIRLARHDQHPLTLPQRTRTDLPQGRRKVLRETDRRRHPPKLHRRRRTIHVPRPIHRPVGRDIDRLEVEAVSLRIHGQIGR